MRYNTYI